MNTTPATRTSTRHHTRAKFLPLVTLIAAIVSVLAPIAPAHGMSQPNRSAQIICVQIGLTPDNMVALGIEPDQVPSVLKEITERETLVSRLNALIAKRENLVRSIQEQRTTPARRSASASPDALLRTLETTMQDIRYAELALLRALLPPQTDPSLIERVCKPQGPAALLPAEYRTLELSQEQSSRLSEALAAERHAQSSGTPLDPKIESILTKARSNPAFREAKARIDAHLQATSNIFFR